MIRRKGFVSFLLIFALLQTLVAPFASAAGETGISVNEEEKTITIVAGTFATTDDIKGIQGYDPFYTVVNYGAITGGDQDFPNPLQNLGVVQGGQYSGLVENLAESADVNGHITDGSFYGQVKNVGVNQNVMPVISGGTFYGSVENTGSIIGGVFEESSTVYNRFLGLKNGVFKGTVHTERYPINGGLYSGTVVLEHLGSITNGTFTETVSVIQKTNWTYISGGVFECPVDNIGMVSGGTFNNSFTNSGVVSCGTFNAAVHNKENGTMSSANGKMVIRFNGSVINDGLIDACDFKKGVDFVNNGELYVFASICDFTGINPTFVGRYFRYGDQVWEGLKRYDQEHGLDNTWLRRSENFQWGDGTFLATVEIEEDRTFSLQAAENVFVYFPVVEVKHADHQWGEALISWAGDYSAATITLVCRAGQEMHRKILAAKIESEAVDPSCTEDGYLLYTASVEVDGVTYRETKKLSTLPATGHQWKDGFCEMCGEPSSEPEDEIVYGDANGDGLIDGRDVILIKKHLAARDYETGQSSVEVESGADANGDGFVSGRDLILIMKYLACFDYESGTPGMTLGPQQ